MTPTTLVLVDSIAPPKPDCFQTRAEWVEFLTYSQKYLKSRPFDRHVYRKGFNFCADCTHAYMERMTAQGKCNPSLYVDRSPDSPKVPHV